MSITVTTLASLIESGSRNSAGGSDGATIGEQVLGNNSIIEIGGNLYAVITTFQNYNTVDLSTSSVFRIRKSTNGGITWSTVGSSFSPTAVGGGMAHAVIGSVIWISYSKSYNDTAQNFLYLVNFDTATNTWSSELSLNLATAFSVVDWAVEGPYNMHVRLDGSIVMPITACVAPSSIAIVTYDGSFHGPYMATPFEDSQARLFCQSIMAADGTIHIFYGYGTPLATLFHRSFSTGNSYGTEHQMTGFSGHTIAWNDMGLEAGILDPADGHFYLACGFKTAAFPTIWGRPCIMYGTDSAWTLGAEIDNDLTYADYSVLCAVLVLMNNQLIFYWRGISSDGTHYIDRIGYAPRGSHDTPANWTWSLIYDMASPSPAVSGKTAPYKQAGAETGGYQDGVGSVGVALATNEIRIVTTLADVSDNTLFPVYMHSIAVPVDLSITIDLATGSHGIPSGEAFGTPGSSVGDVVIIPDAIPSEEALGTPGDVAGTLTIIPGGIPSRERIGSTTVNPVPTPTRYNVS